LHRIFFATVIANLQCTEKLAFGELIQLITPTAVCKFTMEISLSLMKIFEYELSSS